MSVQDSAHTALGGRSSNEIVSSANRRRAVWPSRLATRFGARRRIFDASAIISGRFWGSAQFSVRFGSCRVLQAVRDQSGLHSSNGSSSGKSVRDLRENLQPLTKGRWGGSPGGVSR
jgi:hypothetical protein